MLEQVVPEWIEGSSEAITAVSEVVTDSIDKENYFSVLSFQLDLSTFDLL